MAVTMKSIRLDTRLADKAARMPGATTYTEAVSMAVREIMVLRRFKKLMKKYAGNLKFAGHGE